MNRVWTAAIVALLCFAGSARGQQTGAPQLPGQTAAPAMTGGASIGALQSTEQNPLLGGVPSGKAAPGTVRLSLSEALDRALRYNLAVLLSGQAREAARGERWRQLSKLLPQVKAQTSETVQQIDLRSLGFPGFDGIPSIIGPFSVFDARGFVSQRVFDLNSLYNARASADELKAARYSYQDARDLVVLVAVNLYLEADAGESRVEAAQSEVKTADALYRLAVDRRKAGLAAGIDVLRAQVELEAQQQRLIFFQNEFDKQKLDLERAIGLPVAQAIQLTDRVRPAPIPTVTLEAALDHAYRTRADYQSAKERLAAAKASERAARGDGLPSLDFDANYGDIGVAPGVSHGTFTVAGTLTIPIFQGGKVHGEVLQAHAVVNQRESELADLRNRIEYEVRTALLDLNATGKQVQVAESALKLAQEQLQQAQDRFAAGVVNSLEVVQAQEAVATANENLISSLYANNVAKASLARAMGGAEATVKQYLGGMK